MYGQSEDLRAFDDVSLVAPGEHHWSSKDAIFRLGLIRNPAFAQKVCKIQLSQVPGTNLSMKSLFAQFVRSMNAFSTSPDSCTGSRLSSGLERYGWT